MQTEQAPSCEDGRHTTCIHVLDRPARVRQEREVGDDLAPASLCTCACHEDCPLAHEEGGARWPSGCICPGTLRLLEHGEKGGGGTDLAQRLRATRDEAQRASKARRELRQRAQGLSSDEASRLLEEIWVAHGLKVPPAYAKVRLVDSALGSRLDDARTTVDALGGAGRAVGRFVRTVRGRSHDDEPTPRTDYVIETGRDSTEVVVEADAGPRLAALSDKAVFASQAMTALRVVLRDGAGGSIGVYARDADSERPLLLGLIPAAEAAPYRPSLAAAARVGQEAVCRALRVGTRGGRWRLYVLRPLSPDDASGPTGFRNA